MRITQDDKKLRKQATATLDMSKKVNNQLGWPLWFQDMRAKLHYLDQHAPDEHQDRIRELWAIVGENNPVITGGSKIDVEIDMLYNRVVKSHTGAFINGATPEALKLWFTENNNHNEALKDRKEWLDWLKENELILRKELDDQPQ